MRAEYQFPRRMIKLKRKSLIDMCEWCYTVLAPINEGLRIYHCPICNEDHKVLVPHNWVYRKKDEGDNRKKT